MNNKTNVVAAIVAAVATKMAAAEGKKEDSRPVILGAGMIPTPTRMAVRMTPRVKGWRKAASVRRHREVARRQRRNAGN